MRAICFGGWTRARSHGVTPLALVLVMTVGCAAKVTVAPTPFKNSDAFKKVRKDALGFLDHDFNGDGIPDAVVVTRDGEGMRPQVFVQTAGETGGVWSHACNGPTLLGEELDTLRWVQPGPRELLLVVASTENPDTLQQSFALMAQPCTAVFQEQVSLQKPAYELVSPGEVPGGVLVDDAGRVHVIDHAQTVQLRGASGEVEILKSVRERVLTDDGARITVTEKPRSFVAPRVIRVVWRHGEPAVRDDLAVLTDENSETSFVAKAGEEGVLEIDSGRQPMVILDVAHGCGDGNSGHALTLTPETANDDTHVVGGTPDAKSFVQGVGHRPRAAPNEQRDVLVLREAVTKLSLRVGPGDADRCLRDVRAYGFLSP